MLVYLPYEIIEIYKSSKIYDSQNLVSRHSKQQMTSGTNYISGSTYSLTFTFDANSRLIEKILTHRLDEKTPNILKSTEDLRKIGLKAKCESERSDDIHFFVINESSVQFSWPSLNGEARYILVQNSLNGVFVTCGNYDIGAISDMRRKSNRSYYNANGKRF